MDQKNFIVAIVLSVLIIMGWQYALPAGQAAGQQRQQQQTASHARQPDGAAERAGQPGAPGAPPGAPAPQPPRSRS